MHPSQGGGGLPSETTLSPTLTDSGLVTMTEVLWKTLTRTTGPYFLALGTKVMQRRLSATRDVNVISQPRLSWRNRASQLGVGGGQVSAGVWGQGSALLLTHC